MPALRRSSRRKTGPPAKLTYDENGVVEAKARKTPKKTTKKKASKSTKKAKATKSSKRSKSPAPKKKSPAKKSAAKTTSSSSSKKGKDNSLVMIAIAIVIAYFVLQQCGCLDDLVKAVQNVIPTVSASEIGMESSVSSVFETVSETMASTFDEVKTHLN